MERKLSVIIGLLVVLLMINLWAVLKLNQVPEEAAAETEGRMSYEVHRLSNQIDNLSSTVDAIDEQLSWVQDVAFDVDEGSSDPDGIQLDVSVSLTEVHERDDVLLELRDEGDETWTEVRLDAEGEAYTGRLLLDPDGNYQYRIVRKGEMVKTSEVSAVPMRYYQPPVLRMVGSSSSESNGRMLHYGVQLGFDGKVQVPFFDVDQATAILYEDGERVDDLPLNSRFDEQNDREVWYVDVDLDGPPYEGVTRIDVNVVFQDGREAVRQVYPQDELNMPEWK